MSTVSSAEQSWEEWTFSNLAKGCDRNEIRSILLNSGFSDGETRSLLSSGSNATGLDTSISKSAQSTDSINPGSTDSTNSIHLHNVVAIENDKVELYAVENFLNEEECASIIALIRENNRRSTTTDEGVSEFRTSLTCDLAKLNHPVIDDIDRRMCQYMGIRPEESEQIQGQLYEVGQQFKAHTDYFQKTSDTFDEHIGTQGQRSWTFMVYLNSTREGGATEFPNLDLAIEPTAGTALIWNNRSPDGSCNADTLHCGSPVIQGYKAILTKWFRTPQNTHQFIKEDNEKLPPLTRNGFLLTDVPADMYDAVLNFYQAHQESTNAEHLPKFIQSNLSLAPSQLVELSDELRANVHRELQPIVENWVGDYLEPTYVYGVREYKNSAELRMHRDRLHTHVASVIINVDQTTDTEWPLVIEDHLYRQHKVCLKPGQMLLYEGAKLLHGRPTPFEGENYANVFVHYKLRSQNAQTMSKPGVRL